MLWSGWMKSQRKEQRQSMLLFLLLWK